jgi:hypothetical protein
MNKFVFGTVGCVVVLASAYFLFSKSQPKQDLIVTSQSEKAVSSKSAAKNDSPAVTQTAPTLPPSKASPARQPKLYKSVDDELREVNDLAAHFQSLAANQTANAKFTQAHILQRCAQAVADSKALPTSFKPEVIPDSAPFAVRRNALRVKAKEEQAALIKSCGVHAKQPASEAQVREAYQAAKDLGDPRAAAYFELESYNAKLKLLKPDDPIYKTAVGLESAKIAIGPDEAGSKWLLSLLTSKDEEVSKLAQTYVPENFADKALHFDNKPISGFEWLWAWQLSRCDMGADCSSGGPIMESKCQSDPDTCAVAHYEELYRIEIEGHNKTFPAGATDPARVEAMRRALVAAVRDGNTARFAHVNQPFDATTGLFSDRWTPFKRR